MNVSRHLLGVALVAIVLTGTGSCGQEDTVRVCVPTPDGYACGEFEKDDPVLEDPNVVIPATEEEQACMDRKAAEGVGGDFRERMDKMTNDMIECRREALG